MKTIEYWPLFGESLEKCCTAHAALGEWSKVVSGILTDLANMPLGSKDPVPRLTPAPEHI